MVCVPAAKVDKPSDAVPVFTLPNTVAGAPRVNPPDLKVTVPEMGTTPPVLVIIAFKLTVPPVTAGFGLAVSVIVVVSTAWTPKQMLAAIAKLANQTAALEIG